MFQSGWEKTVGELERLVFITKKVAGASKRVLKKTLAKIKEPKSEVSLPREFRVLFEELGPTFIKFGQMLSLRPDLIPTSFCQEFRALLGEIAPVPFSQIEIVLERNWGKNWRDYFSEFTPTPIGLGSLAQVYRAILIEGPEVIIKVQKNDIKEVIEKDLGLLLTFSKLLSLLPNSRHIKPKKVVEEFSTWTRKELNFVQEGINMESFARLFQGEKNLVIPSVYWTYTTKEVLVTDYLPGKSLEKYMKRSNSQLVSNLNLEKMIKNLSQIVFDQTLKYGFFHADPHPANILILEEERIGLVDFGIMGNFSSQNKDFVFAVCLAMIEKDVEKLFQLLQKFTYQPLIEREKDNLKKELSSLLHKWHDASLEELSITRTIYEILMLGLDYKIDWPLSFILFGKQLVTLDGIALELVPDLNISEFFQPYLYQLFLSRTLKDVNPQNLLQWGIQGIREIKESKDRLDKILKDLEKGDFGLVVKPKKEDFRGFEYLRKSRMLSMWGITLFGSGILWFLFIPAVNPSWAGPEIGLFLTLAGIAIGIFSFWVK